MSHGAAIDPRPVASAHPEGLHGPEVSPDLIGRVTDAVMDAVTERRSRAPGAVCPGRAFDALGVRTRAKDGRTVRAQAVPLAPALAAESRREGRGRGLWIAGGEGAKLRLGVMNEPRDRGVQGVPIAAVDGLRGLPEAITAAFPEATAQAGVVHLVRHSSNFCSWTDRKAAVAGRRAVYGAETAEAARDASEALDGNRGRLAVRSAPRTDGVTGLTPRSPRPGGGPGKRGSPSLRPAPRSGG